MVSDLLEEKEELLRQAEQMKQRIADLEKEVTVWKRASENHSYRALQSEDKYNKQKEINQELVDENESLKTLIKEIKSDVNECFGFEYNILVAKLLNKWEMKEE